MNIKEELRSAFRALTPLEMASKELIEAQRSLLESESAVEYAQSVVAYNVSRIKRLKTYISKETTA
jgi:hypothetical protein